jgi:Flp pilus assembly protein TadB
MIAAFAGGLFAVGLLVLLQGIFPRQNSLKARLAEFNSLTDDNLLVNAEPTLMEELAVTLLETVKGDDMETVRSNLMVVDRSLADFAMEKAKAAASGAVFVGFLSVLVGLSGGAGVLILALGGAIAGYQIPDIDLKKKAAERRVEFSRALTAFITLLGSSISGGGGITTAMTDAAAMGEGWVFVKLRNALDEAHLSGISTWSALDRLGRQLQVTSLIELAGSLTLAGNSGARVTETLHARAESSREKELAEIRSEAEAKSSSIGLPVGLMLVGWAIFIAIPAVMSLMGISA